MSYEDLSSTFDVKNAKTRAFSAYDVLEKADILEKPELSDIICQGMTSEISYPIKTSNIDKIKKRRFPAGHYAEVAVTTDKFIALGHVIVQDSQNNRPSVFLINWNVIQEINIPVVPSQNSESPAPVK